MQPNSGSIAGTCDTCNSNNQQEAEEKLSIYNFAIFETAAGKPTIGACCDVDGGLFHAVHMSLHCPLQCEQPPLPLQLSLTLFQSCHMPYAPEQSSKLVQSTANSKQTICGWQDIVDSSCCCCCASTLLTTTTTTTADAETVTETATTTATSNNTSHHHQPQHSERRRLIM